MSLQSPNPPIDQPITESARPRAFPDVIIDRTQDGSVIVLHPALPYWALTDEAGLEALRILDGNRSVAELAADRARRYPEVEYKTILRDLLDFSEQLRRAHLLENHPGRASNPDHKPQPPPSLTIYTTEECNLRCKHCAIVEGRMPPTLLTEEDIKRLIDEHTTNFSNPVISFLGGEPFLRPDCLDLLEYASRRTTKAKIGTNGLLITEENVGRIASIPVDIQVSLDGPDPETHDFIRGKGTFARTWRAIEILIAAGAAPRLTIANTLTQSMLDHVQEFVARIDGIGPIQVLRFLTLNKMRAAAAHWERISPDMEEMKRIYKWLLFDLREMDRTGKTPVKTGFPGFVPDARADAGHWCPLGQTFIVDSQGKTYNCPIFNTPEYEIGDISKVTLKAMGETERNLALRKAATERRHAVEECRACAWRNFCQGGCAAYSTLQSGSLYVNDELCEFRRDLYREHVQRFSRKS